MSSDEKNWYAIYTKSRHEKRVEEHLQEKGYETFLPLVLKKNQWSDRVKTVEVPLIKSYVFVKVESKNLIYVLQTQGVVRIIKIGAHYTKIPEYQIEALRTVLEERMAVTPEDYFSPGEKVIVVDGPLKDKIGRVIDVSGKSKLLLSIDAINFAFSTPIYMQDVKKSNKILKGKKIDEYSILQHINS